MTSKAAFLILSWNFLIRCMFQMSKITGIVTLTESNNIASFFIVTEPIFVVMALLLLFYPLAGFVADVCCGRYKVVIVSLWFIWSGTLVICIGLIFLIPNVRSLQTIITVYAAVAFIPLLLFLIGFCGFQANALQLGVDQLHDATTEHITIFIHWFLWTSYLADGITKILLSLKLMETAYFNIDAAIIFVPTLTLVSLTVVLILSCCKRKWFVVDSGSRNPYKLVYRVLRFAAKNKYPIQRSAFTYCEDELPSRIDFGKHKYGGPFTTEEVEDVKTFLGILKLLCCFGPTFTSEVAAYYALYPLSYHLNRGAQLARRMLVNSGSLPAILGVIILSLYITLFRPLIYRRIPGSLKRMGVGIIFLLLAILYSFAVDTAAHNQQQRNASSCIFSANSTALEIDSYVLVGPSIFVSFAYIFIYTSVFEFICAQSPYAMKGLLIGVFFALKGVFQLFGVLLWIPFNYWKPLFPSCGFGYYLVNVFIAIVGLVVYTVAARRYKYRQRDEPCNVRRFVEEYYGRIQEEPYYDYEPID